MSMRLFTENMVDTYDLTGITEDLGNYKMTITAWSLRSVGDNMGDPFKALDGKFEELEKMLSEADFSNMKSILSTGLDLVVDAGIAVYNEVKDAVNVAENVYDETGSVLDASFSAMDVELGKVMKLLGTYTDGAFKSDDIRGRWVLPVPETLTDSIRHTYDQDTFSPLEKMAAKTPYMAIKMFGGENTKNMIDQVIKFNVDQAKRNNYTFDNNLLNIYKSTDEREFIFNVPIIPQSYDHFKQILRGVAAMKVLMTGKHITSNMLLKQECVFTVSFENDYFTRYMLLNDQVELNLETLEVDVSGNPFIAFDGDINSGGGVPKLIQLIMTFRERRPMRNDLT